MSFILDALRKSDQQRQRGATPTLLTAPALAAEPKKPAYWIHGLLAALLVGAGIMIGWLRPWQPEQPARGGRPVGGQHIAPATTAVKPPESTPRQAAPAPLPALSGMSRMPAQQPPIQKPVAPPASFGAATVQDRSAPSPSSADARHTPPTPLTAAPQEPPPPSEKPASPTDSAPEQKAMAMSELPASIRQELPAMQILLHQYSSRPRNRFVTINNQTLQEGESVAPGITLEQITPDGMILNYRGYRFRRGVR